MKKLVALIALAGVAGAAVAVGVVLVFAGGGVEGEAAGAPAAEAPAQTEPEFDPTTVPEDEVVPEDDLGIEAVVGDIQSSIKESWNRCKARDVCIPGETARDVECTLPESGVSKLECFVSVTKPDADGYASGYTVEVTVNGDSYSWGLAS